MEVVGVPATRRSAPCPRASQLLAALLLVDAAVGYPNLYILPTRCGKPLSDAQMHGPAAVVGPPGTACSAYVARNDGQRLDVGDTFMPCEKLTVSIDFHGTGCNILSDTSKPKHGWVLEATGGVGADAPFFLDGGVAPSVGCGGKRWQSFKQDYTGPREDASTDEGAGATLVLPRNGSVTIRAAYAMCSRNDDADEPVHVTAAVTLVRDPGASNFSMCASVPPRPHNGKTAELPALTNGMRTHGCLQLLGWVALAIPGALVASRNRRLGATATAAAPSPLAAPQQQAPVPAAWFQIHQASQTTGVLLSLLGIATAYCTLGGLQLNTLHAKVGVALGPLALAQVGLGLVRPPTDGGMTRKRWRLAHMTLGFSLLLMACLCIGTGLSMVLSGTVAGGVVATSAVVTLSVSVAPFILTKQRATKLDSAPMLAQDLDVAPSGGVGGLGVASVGQLLVGTFGPFWGLALVAMASIVVQGHINVSP